MGDELFEPVQAGGKLRCPHVCLVAARAKPAQRLLPDVRETTVRQAGFERLPIELGVALRPREMAHVDELSDAVLLQQLDELVERAG